ncbi:MAG: hypothetical protein BGO38_12645 [Cellulomonas sp. 73-145]|uniref:hypothetical protein n=1 Tax=Cellulomonas sp. 73-145 TaxID=1895739 RepID=UPI0009269FD0|nr:hypothetical protein [Cellulomonas sp. 73-145]OJV59643.1 MAG: hypothetical protein BGO38_12645 [Cellulomonas sp. 73-145]
MGLEQDAGELGAQVEAAMGGALRSDVVWQLFNAVAHQRVLHATLVTADGPGRDVVSGTLLLLLRSTVAFVELTDAPWSRSPGATQWSATVELRPRTTLAAVRVRGFELLGGRDNSVAPHRLSATSVIELTYRGCPPLTLERDPVSGALDDLLATLLTDLAASAPPTRDAASS